MGKLKNRFREIDRYEKEFIGRPRIDYEFGIDLVPAYFFIEDSNMNEEPIIIVDDFFDKE